MNVTLKFLFFFIFLLNAASGESELDPVENSEERSRQFHIEQNKNTRESIKIDMDSFFSNLWEKMTKRNADTILQLERHQEILSANLSREFNENMENMYRNLSEKLESSDMKVEASLRNLSDSFDEKLRRVESTLSGEHGSLNETLQGHHQQLSSSITYPRSLTEVQEVNADEGTIEFNAGTTNPHLRRKIWVLKSKGDASIRYMSFMLMQNNLGSDADLFLWGSLHDGGNQQMWNGSESTWQQARTNHGHVILVTMVISPGRVETPSFKLKFNTTNTLTPWACSSEIVSREGHRVVSFPTNNVQNYPSWSRFVAVIAHPKGDSFGLTLKYLDLPGTPPDNCNSEYFFVYFLEETPTGFHYKRLPSSAYTRCGKVGDISEPLGNYPVAIIQFYNQNSNVGRGLRVDVN